MSICYQAVFGELEEGAVYLFRVKAHTTKGAGPWSDVASFTVDRDVLRSPLAVNAIATSDTSVEVWWEPVPNRGKVIGYQVSCPCSVSRTLSWSINFADFLHHDCSWGLGCVEPQNCGFDWIHWACEFGKIRPICCGCCCPNQKCKLLTWNITIRTNNNDLQ